MSSPNKGSVRCSTVEEFLARRQLAAFKHEMPRCYGISSNALALYATGYRHEPTLYDYPSDQSDLDACERTYAMAPEHLLDVMKPVMAKYREHVAAKWARQR